MNELIWFLCPINSILWMAGGTWNKLFRRLGFPILVLFACLWLKHGLWIALGTTILAGLGPWLPFTLNGSKVKGEWINWAWIIVWPLFFTLPSLVHFSLLKMIFICWAWPIVASINVMSNTEETKGIFPWKFCEGLQGFLFMAPYCIN